MIEIHRTKRYGKVLAAMVLCLAAVTACAAPSAAPARHAGSDAQTPPASPQLPRPTGPHAVGRTVLHLVDTHRQDPWVPSAGARQLMVSMYYPARPRTGGPAFYMTTEEARLFLQAKAPGAHVPPTALSGLRTYAHTNARPAHGRFPLLVLSPGLIFPRATLTSLAEDLTSHGYVIALVDHTYESSGTSFPDGRTLSCVVCIRPPAGGDAAVAQSRAKDVAFVIDQLTGRHPAWTLARLIDRHRIGMAGHSIGGDATAATMAADRRIRAGLDMDGTLYAPIPTTGLNHRPFLLLGSQSDHAPGRDNTWDNGWTSLNGWKRWLTVDCAAHGSFTDMPIFQAALGIHLPLSAERSVAITRTYVRAFFDLTLKNKRQPLLEGPSPANPEVHFQNP